MRLPEAIGLIFLTACCMYAIGFLAGAALAKDALHRQARTNRDQAERLRSRGV